MYSVSVKQGKSYRILYDDSSLTLQDNEYFSPGTVTREINSSGSFDFVIYKGHSLYDAIEALGNNIIVECGSADYKKRIFKGRPSTVTINANMSKKVVCEGNLSYLNDYYFEAKSFVESPFTDVLRTIQNTIHDQTFYGRESFSLTSVGMGDVVVDMDVGVQSCYSLTKKLHDIYGGYMVCDCEDNQTLTWYGTIIDECTQEVSFGKNLQELTINSNADNIATRIYPLTPDGEMIYTGNYPFYVDVPEYTQRIPKNINKLVRFTETDDVAKIKTKAQEYADNLYISNHTYQAKCIDLSLIDKEVESFEIGQKIKVKSLPHGMDTVMVCIKRTYSLQDPSKDIVGFGVPTPKITREI